MGCAAVAVYAGVALCDPGDGRRLKGLEEVAAIACRGLGTQESSERVEEMRDLEGVM